MIRTIAAAFSMFSAIPMPKTGWDEESIRFLPAAFPLVGIVVGLLEGLWMFLAFRFSFPTILTSAVACVLPILVTGGIHLDGYMDVSDALSSCGDAEKKREILADPHIGAFAVIRLAVYLILSFGFVSGLSFQMKQMLLFGCSFILSRCLSALAVCILPMSKGTGLAHTFQSGASRKLCVRYLGMELGAVALVMVVGGGTLAGFKGVFEAVLMMCCAAGQWLHLRSTARDQFGGLSGDLNGWFLVKAELWMLGALVLSEIVLS